VFCFWHWRIFLYIEGWVYDILINVVFVTADVPFEEGWRIEVKQRTGGSSAGTSDAVS
jgi:hypothetical protein